MIAGDTGVISRVLGVHGLDAQDRHDLAILHHANAFVRLRVYQFSVQGPVNFQGLVAFEDAADQRHLLAPVHRFFGRREWRDERRY